jgi:hypothetical protein
MTTYFEFAPSQQAPFQFQPTFDGSIYTVIVTWNLFGKRYYVNVYTLDNVLVLTLPLISSPVGLNIQNIAWELGVVTVETTIPHGYKIGETVELTISGCQPDAYNGKFRVLVTSATAFTYQNISALDQASTLGVVNYNISLTAGYFTSTLVFREANMQFEVNP